MFDEPEHEYSLSKALEVEDPFPCKKKKKNKDKRRFSDEQIRSLETMFESETRLEPRKKLQLARELGLKPRQVAIWFQNKRARWKLKQLEREFRVLRANYNSLASQFAALKKEKQALSAQLEKLNDTMRRSNEKTECYGEGKPEKRGDGKSENGDTIHCKYEEKPCPAMERFEHGVAVQSDHDRRVNGENLGLEGPYLLTVEPFDSSMASPEDWDRLDSNALFNNSNSSNQWLDFWS